MTIQLLPTPVAAIGTPQGAQAAASRYARYRRQTGHRSYSNGVNRDATAWNCCHGRRPINVRFTTQPRDVRFVPKADVSLGDAALKKVPRCLLLTQSGHQSIGFSAMHNVNVAQWAGALFLLRKYQFASRSQFLWQHTVIDKLVYGGRDIYCPSQPHYRTVPEIDFTWLPLSNIALQ
jgi:hypothetical protein